MKLDLKQENINSSNYFQSNLFLNEVDAKFVYGLEKIIEKDKLYSRIREIGDINYNYVTRKKIFIENKYIYNESELEELGDLDRPGAIQYARDRIIQKYDKKAYHQFRKTKEYLLPSYRKQMKYFNKHHKDLAFKFE